MQFHECISHAYIVNLPERKDRRREMQKMLKRTGLDSSPGWATFFSAIRPDSAGTFPSRGAKGCFMSHLEVLRWAKAENLPNVLVMEDDLEIDDCFNEHVPSILETLSSTDWSIAYFGHLLGSEIQPSADRMQPTSLPVRTTHFYAVNGTQFSALIQFLERVIERPPGHPDGGPMHYDGALSTFRQQHPEKLTLVACPNLGWQRSSRSDITSQWFDRTPLLREMAGFARQVLDRRKPRPGVNRTEA